MAGGCVVDGVEDDSGVFWRVIYDSVYYIVNDRILAEISL